MPPNPRSSRAASDPRPRSSRSEPAREPVSSRSEPIREGKRLTESADAVHAVAVALLRARIRDGNFYIQGVNTSYPGAELFESHLSPPGPTVDAYLTRWLAYCGVHRIFVIVALVYIDRLVATWSSFMLTKWNFHRIFAAAAIVAAKLVDRDAHSPAHLAQLAGLESVDLMRDLEDAFLHLLRNKSHVSRRRRRAAEVQFMRDALDSSRASSVARVLRDEDIEEVD